MSLLDRVRRLEMGYPRAPVSCVVTFAWGEDPEEAIARAARQGVSGGVLVVGEVLAPEVWCQLAADHQQRLLAAVAADMAEV